MKPTTKRAMRALNGLAQKLETAENFEDLQGILALVVEVPALVESAVLAEAVRWEEGNLYRACEAIEVPHRTGARWVASRPELAREVASARKAG
jgi:hypothetical protein